MQPLALSLLLGAALLAAVAQADMKDKVMPKYIKWALECMKEGSVEVDVCKEMRNEGNDNSQEKYNKCKCGIACVAKKAKALTESGEANFDGLTAAIDEFEIKEWTDEWKRVRPECEPVVKSQKNCDLAYDFFVCGFEKSEIFRNVLKKVHEAMSKN